MLKQGNTLSSTREQIPKPVKPPEAQALQRRHSAREQPSGQKELPPLCVENNTARRLTRRSVIREHIMLDISQKPQKVQSVDEPPSDGVEPREPRGGRLRRKTSSGATPEDHPPRLLDAQINGEPPRKMVASDTSESRGDRLKRKASSGAVSDDHIHHRLDSQNSIPMEKESKKSKKKKQEIENVAEIETDDVDVIARDIPISSKKPVRKSDRLSHSSAPFKNADAPGERAQNSPHNGENRQKKSQRLLTDFFPSTGSRKRGHAAVDKKRHPNSSSTVNEEDIIDVHSDSDETSSPVKLSKTTQSSAELPRQGAFPGRNNNSPKTPPPNSAASSSAAASSLITISDSDENNSPVKKDMIRPNRVESSIQAKPPVPSGDDALQAPRQEFSGEARLHQLPKHSVIKKVVIKDNKDSRADEARRPLPIPPHLVRNHGSIRPSLDQGPPTSPGNGAPNEEMENREKTEEGDLPAPVVPPSKINCLRRSTRRLSVDQAKVPLKALPDEAAAQKRTRQFRRRTVDCSVRVVQDSSEDEAPLDSQRSLRDRLSTNFYNPEAFNRKPRKMSLERKTSLPRGRLRRPSEPVEKRFDFNEGRSLSDEEKEKKKKGKKAQKMRSRSQPAKSKGNGSMSYYVHRILSYDPVLKQYHVCWLKWNITCSTWNTREQCSGAPLALKEYQIKEEGLAAVMEQVKAIEHRYGKIEFKRPTLIVWPEDEWLTDEELDRRLRASRPYEYLGYWFFKRLEIEWLKILDPEASFTEAAPLYVECWYEEKNLAIPKDFEFANKYTFTDGANSVIKNSRRSPCSKGCKCHANCCTKCKEEVKDEEAFIVCKLEKGSTMVSGLRPDVLGAQRLLFLCDDNCKCPQKAKITLPSLLRKDPLVIFRDPVKNWTVRTLVDIPQGKIITEYFGIVSTEKEADNDHSFQFDIGEKLVIDARLLGNEARFVSHSCDPNTTVICAHTGPRSKGYHRLIYVALRDIKKGEEITIDYHPAYPTKHPDDPREKQGKPRVFGPCACFYEFCRTWL